MTERMVALTTWNLIAPDATVFGRVALQEGGADMFWHNCTFAPTPAFDVIAPLFLETRRLLERDEMEAFEAAYDRIAALGLELHPVGGGEPIRDFLLHIDGEQAQLRY